ncbi:MAG: aspartate dehydrogenase [Chloroflexi bacterium]|nr:aspartate dehydrogenase [Chloroflexota bacterium]
MRDGPVRIGFLGFGTIARRVCALIAEQAPEEFAVVGAIVRDPAKARPAGAPKLVASVAELLAEQPEVVVEAGGHDALANSGPEVLRGGCDLLMVSVGAFAREGLLEAITEAAEAGHARARVASGAIGALDAIASAARGGLTRVTHTTRKAPRSLFSPEEAQGITETVEVFRGPAREAALRFPENVNVCAAVSLAGIGLDRTEMRIVADPSVDRNQHEVEAEGEFGWLRFEIQNIPTEKPATGRLVAMSVFKELQARRSPFQIG